MDYRMLGVGDSLRSLDPKVAHFKREAAGLRPDVARLLCLLEPKTEDAGHLEPLEVKGPDEPRDAASGE